MIYFYTIKTIFPLIFLYLINGVSAAAFAANSAKWPMLPLPENVQVTSVGEEFSLNGTPMRAHTFISSAPAHTLVTYFRQQLGQSATENTLGSQTVLGRATGSQNDFYLTVQIEAAGKGSRGIIAVTHLKAAYERQTQTQIDHEYWLTQLPAGSHLTSSMSSIDKGFLSRHLVFSNYHGESANSRHLKNLMHAKGFELEQKTDAQTHQLNGTTLYFKGPGKEAMATIARTSTSQTVVVLNILTPGKSFK